MICFYSALLFVAQLFLAQPVHADVVMLAANDAQGVSEEQADHRRYENDLEKMNQTSDEIAHQIFSKKAQPDVAAGNKGDSMQITLIRVSR